MIRKRPGVCGGSACIRDTRITVRGLVEYRRLGLTDDQILGSVQGLTRKDLAAAWKYFARHEQEIERDIRENDEDG
ncbi:MAG: DUF433 domain-containing protein [Planctomycetes bacterium]|nr:DUF433 domain-containing protein [Planctomycetota bacterium]